VGISRHFGDALLSPRRKRVIWDKLKNAVALLLTAERPMIYTGGGVILGNAEQELRQLVDLLGYPCTNTLMGFRRL